MIFYSLPVGNGDSFVVIDDNFKVVIDGGASKNKISGQLAKYTGIRDINILVCTHNDFDHANGVIGLLRCPCISIKEVWIPGCWSYRLKDMLVRPDDFISKMCDEIESDPEMARRALTDDDYSNALHLLRETDAIYHLEEVLRDDGKIMTPVYMHKIMLFYKFAFYKTRHTKIINYFYQLASNIAEVVTLAVERKCAIRFFEFGSHVGGGLPGKLEPVNSRQISLLSQKNIGILFFLKLTEFNRTSLVFISPENDKKSAILFSADSDLNFPINACVTRPPIVTSPHHGSDSNRMAYSKVHQWINNPEINPIWVRSGPKKRDLPCTTYISQAHKYCVRCRLASRYSNSQLIKIQSQKSLWTIDPSVRVCCCR